MKQIVFLQLENGKKPVADWLKSLDTKTKMRVLARLTRLEEGNKGDVKKISDEISELRLFFGSGYRIYFSEPDKIIILLVNAGNKATQNKDIKKAQEYLENWKGLQNDK